MIHLVDPLLILVELDFILLNAQTFWHDLLRQALSFSVNVHDLIFYNQLAIDAIKHLLTHIKLLLLWQD